MPLSSDLVAQFTKATNDSKRESTDGALNGTIIKYGDLLYVRLDGSNEITPVARTVEVAEGDRVQVAIKNHTAVVTGNTTDPAIGVVRAGDLETKIAQTAEEIRLEAKNTKEALEASISLTAEAINSKVSATIQQVSVEYCSLDSSTEIPDNSDNWSASEPVFDSGKYVWCRYKYVTQGGDISYSTPMCISGASESNIDLTYLETQINQNAAAIELKASQSSVDALGNKVTAAESSITANANNITSIVTRNQEFSQFQQTVEGFAFMNKGGTVKISGGDINLTGAITWDNLASDAQTKVDTASTNASNALTQSQTANTNAASAAAIASNAMTTVSGFTITSGSTTYIDGSMIYSGSIYSNSIHLGGQLTVYQTMYSNTVGGYLGYCSGFNSNNGIGIMHAVNKGQCICTDQAARLSFGGDSSVVTSSSGAFINGKSAIYFEISESRKVVMDYQWFRPNNDGAGNIAKMYLGSSSAPWSAVYASTGEISTSDRNQKNSIEDLPEKYIEMYSLLQPKRFKLNSGTSDRYHVGYIAQDVEEAMIASGIDSKEFGGFVKDKDENGNDVYLLRYGEFDAIRDAKIKQLEAKNEELEERVKNLENLVAQLLNKT